VLARPASSTMQQQQLTPKQTQSVFWKLQRHSAPELTRLMIR